MHRRGGKRIRMDEPPPEYENPMTPAVDHDNYGHYSGASYGDSYTELAGTSSSDGMFESPPTPGLRRITRSKAKGVTQPPPSVPAVIHSPPSAPVRGRGRGRPPGRKNNFEGIPPGEDESSLYHIIRSCKASLTNIVDEWIESYKVSILVVVVTELYVEFICILHV